MNILLVYPEFPDTFWSFKYALKFVGKKVTNPPLGLLTIAPLLPAGWNKRLVDMNVTSLKISDIEWADLVMVSAMEVQKTSAAQVIHTAKIRGKAVIAGGPLFTSEAESFPEVSTFVLNEAEITLPLFLEDFKNGVTQKVYRTDKYADITGTPVPQWNLLDMNAYECMSVQFSRGCPYNCDFCNVTALLGHRPRTKTAAQLVAEIDSLYSSGWRRNIFLVDDNFIGNKKILKDEVLPALIRWRKGKTGCMFLTEASINLSDDPELMRLMVRAGFISVFVGIETPDEESLAECNKTQNKNRDLLASIHQIQQAGLQVMGGFIVGFDNDTPDIFQRQINFIQKSGVVTAMMGILQAPNGTQLYERLEKEGRILSVLSGDNGDGTTNIIPKMPAETLRQGFFTIIRELYSPELLYPRIRTLLLNLPANQQSSLLQINEIMAFFLSVLKLGIIGKERVYYWKLIFWTLRHFPAKLPLAVTMTIYGYHFRTVGKMREKLFQIQPAKISIKRSTSAIAS